MAGEQGPSASQSLKTIVDDTHRKWQLARQLGAHHDHPRHPEKQNIVAWPQSESHRRRSHARKKEARARTGLQQLPGVEAGQVRGVVGPAKDGDWEDAGGEPRVQHILVLAQLDLVRTNPEPRGRLWQLRTSRMLGTLTFCSASASVWALTQYLLSTSSPLEPRKSKQQADEDI